MMIDGSERVGGNSCSRRSLKAGEGSLSIMRGRKGLIGRFISLFFLKKKK